MCPRGVSLVRRVVPASFVADPDQAKQRARFACTLAALDRCCRARGNEAFARLDINGNVLPKVALLAIALVLGSINAVALFNYLLK
jgi:hypothetical protein